MDRWILNRCAAAALAVVAATSFVLVSARAQTPAATPAALSAPSATAAMSNASACMTTADAGRFLYPLTRTARRLALGAPIKIVAIGSSSTFGAGASSASASYPGRLAVELKALFPENDITVLNRGVNGDEAEQMLARMEKDVIAEKPDLVLWQVGSNSVLRNNPLAPHAAMIHDGIVRLKASGADVVLIDPQYAPKVISQPSCEGMVALIAAAAKADSVNLFRRFAMMRHWHDVEHMPFDKFLSRDEIHMNDWSYGCVAKSLATAIAEAAIRPTATATGPRVPPR
jgi:acyl-CoA thioesterase I